MFVAASRDLATYACASFERRISVPRTRTGAGKLLEKLDHFRLAGNFSDHPFVILGHERRGFFAREFFVFLVKLGIAVLFNRTIDIPILSSRTFSIQAGYASVELKLQRKSPTLMPAKTL
jgi:hypothetical protein